MKFLKQLIISLVFFVTIRSWSQCVNLSGVFLAMNESKTAAMQIDQKDCISIRLSYGNFINNAYSEEFDLGTLVAEGKQEYCPDYPRFKCREFTLTENGIIFNNSNSEVFKEHGTCRYNQMQWSLSNRDLIKKFISVTCEDDFTGDLSKTFPRLN